MLNQLILARGYLLAPMLEEKRADAVVPLKLRWHVREILARIFRRLNWT